MFDYMNPWMLPLGFFFFICSSIGVFGNTVMIICTLRTKRFRSPCHILICCTCLADLMHVLGQFPFCVHLFGNSQCYYMLIIPIVGFTTGGPLVLAMGIDRFIAVKYPTKYRYYQDEPRQYIMTQLVFPVVYALFFLAYGFHTKNTDVKNQITCSNPLSLNGSAFQYYTYSSAIIYIVIFFIYLSVYLMLKSNKASSKFKNVFRSILVIVGFVLAGWASTSVANTFSYIITENSTTIILIQMYAGVTVNIAVASNLFVFYAINTDYREVIRFVLRFKNRVNIQVLEASSTTGVHTMSQKSSIPNASRRMTVI